MIEKEECGIFLCCDAVLALIPIFIILATVTQIQINPSDSHMELVMFHEAQDTLDLMSVKIHPYEPSTLELISTSISSNNLESANEIADSYLKKKISNRKYRLVEINHLNGKEICSFGDMNSASITAVAVKSHNSYFYKLYLGL